MLKMLLVFCHGFSANQLSAVEDESFERSKSRREGELWLVSSISGAQSDIWETKGILL